MSWRDRDYARLTGDERRALFGSSAPSNNSRARSNPAGYRRRRRSSPTLLLAVAISAAAAVAGHRYLRIPLHLPHPATEPQATSAIPSPTSAPEARSKMVSIHWRRSDIAPAATAGRICVTMTQHGRVCATYVAGEKPADTLTRRLTSLGLQVHSSG